MPKNIIKQFILSEDYAPTFLDQITFQYRKN